MTNIRPRDIFDACWEHGKKNLDRNVREVVEKPRQSSNSSGGRMRRAAAAAAMTVILVFSGCAGRIKVVNAPPGVNPAEVTAWYEATGYLAFLSEVTKESTVAVQRLREIRNADGQPAIPSSVTIPLLTVFGRMAQTELTAEAYLRALPQHFDKPAAQRLKAYYGEFSAEFQKAAKLDLTGLPSQHAQVISNFLAKIDGVLNALSAFLGRYVVLQAHVDVDHEGGGDPATEWLGEPRLGGSNWRNEALSQKCGRSTRGEDVAAPLVSTKLVTKPTLPTGWPEAHHLGPASFLEAA